MRLSVIIPVYNDSSGIDATLRSVTGQDHTDYEVIPVDNHSDDETPAIIRRWAHRCPDRVRPAAEHETQSSYAARNTGIRAARGDVLVFLDANMTAPPDWLSQIDAAFTTSEVDYLGYEIEVYLPEGEHSFWGWYDTVMGLPARYHYETKHFAPTAALAARRTVFERVGLFDATAASGGDKAFGQRVHRATDLTMGFRGDIRVFHPARTTFAAHCNKAVRVGRGMARLYADAPSADQAREALRELRLHALPPDPRRIVRRAPGVPAARLPALYVADLVIRYVRLYGALRYLWTSSSE